MRTRALLVVACVVGVAVCAMLQAGSAAGTSGWFDRVCGASQRFDCSSALASRWGQLGPLPTAVWGLCYFLFLAIWYAVAGLPNRAGRAWHAVPMFITALGAAISVYLGYVLLFRLPALCPWCLVVHGLNLLILVGTFVSWPRHAEARPAGAAGLLPVEPRPGGARVAVVLALSVSLSLAVAATLYAVYYAAMFSRTRAALLDATNSMDYLAWDHARSVKRDLPVRPDDWMLGTANAAHTLVAFVDFQCPHCREFEAVAPELARRYADSLRIVFRHYPMCRACSPRLPPLHDLHRFACDAALAAEAARTAAPDWRRAWYYRLELFARASDLAARPWLEIARKAGIDESRFREALAAPAARRRIEEDVALARDLDIDGAGALFLDGRRLAAWRIVTTDLPPRTDELHSIRLWNTLLGIGRPLR